MDPKKFFAELKRRNVYKVAVVYAVIGWIVMQIASTVLPTFHTPEWVLQTLVVIVALGFPVALVLAWAFELTPEGIKRAEDVAPNESITRKTGRKLLAIIVVVALAALCTLLGSIWLRREREAASIHAMTTRLPASLRSVAVLPLKNLSGDPAQDYFADGITDSLTTDLSHIHSLRVISFRSVQQYKGERKKILPEIARELNVDAVVEGSIQRSGDTVIINAQLIEAPTDKNLWAERYTRNTRDMLNTQNEIVLAIMEAIKVQLTPEEKSRFARGRSVNPEAQSHYFLGRFQFGQGTEASLRQAIREFKDAIGKDGGLAPAYAGIADCYSSLSSFYMAPREAMPKAEEAAREALRLDPELAEAHSALGYVQLFFHWNRSEGERELLKAIALNPNDSTARMNYGILLLTNARFDEAIGELRQAQDLEPTSATISFQTEWALFLAGKYDQTIHQAEHTLTLEPKMSGSYSQMGLAYLYKGDKERALAALKKAVEMEATSVNTTYYAFALAVAGEKEEGERVLERFIEQSRGKYICAYEVASAYEGMNNRAKALEWLQRGHDEKCDCLVWGSTEPWMGGFRKDPRYKAILARTGLLQ